MESPTKTNGRVEHPSIPGKHASPTQTFPLLPNPQDPEPRGPNNGGYDTFPDEFTAAVGTSSLLRVRGLRTGLFVGVKTRPPPGTGAPSRQLHSRRLDPNDLFRGEAAATAAAAEARSNDPSSLEVALLHVLLELRLLEPMKGPDSRPRCP